MKLLYEGKTKDVFEIEDGNYLLKFKDDATGADGVFDPGANTVGLKIEGMGRSGLSISVFFFEKIKSAGIPTHFVSADVEKAEMIVRPAKKFGKGVEVICRYRAVGSFLRRYGLYISEGQELDALVEVTLKDDERGDPLITREALEALGIMAGEQYDALQGLTRKISSIIKSELAERGMELYDIKLEYGLIGSEIALIDEISAGNMRVFKDGSIVEPLDLAGLLSCENRLVQAVTSA